MTTHRKDKEEDLSRAEDLAAGGAGEDVAGVGHVVDGWVGEFELAEGVAGVGGDEAEAEDEEDAAMKGRRDKGVSR